MKLTFEVEFEQGSIKRDVEIKAGWFGMVRITVNGQTHTLSSDDTFRIVMPVTVRIDETAKAAKEMHYGN